MQITMYTKIHMVPGAMSAAVQGDLVILDMTSNVYFGLNEVAGGLGLGANPC